MLDFPVLQRFLSIFYREWGIAASGSSARSEASGNVGFSYYFGYKLQTRVFILKTHPFPFVEVGVLIRKARVFLSLNILKVFNLVGRKFSE